MFKFLIYKYYSHQESISTYQFLSENTNSVNSPEYLPQETIFSNSSLLNNVASITEEIVPKHYFCRYCDKSFPGGHLLIQHLYTHIDGVSGANSGSLNVCPFSSECEGVDLMNETLLSHIYGYHPANAAEMQLDHTDAYYDGNDESRSIASTSKELSTGTSSYQDKTSKVGAPSSTPVCTVKPLSHTSTELSNDLANTVSAIEAICTSGANLCNSNVIGQKSSHEDNIIFDNGIPTSDEYQHSSYHCTTGFNQHLEKLESTHREFEMAVQEAELVLSEPTDLKNEFMSTNSDHGPKPELICKPGNKQKHVKLRNSTTKSDIESDSGVESVNSHQFQNSPPLYSPNGLYSKPLTSPSTYHYSVDTVVNDKKSTEMLNLTSIQNPKGPQINNSDNSCLAQSSYYDFKANELDSINDIESNFPGVFGHCSNGELPTFSDIIEAETLNLFGNDDPSSSINHFASDNNTNNSLPISSSKNNDRGFDAPQCLETPPSNGYTHSEKQANCVDLIVSKKSSESEMDSMPIDTPSVDLPVSKDSSEMVPSTDLKSAQSNDNQDVLNKTIESGRSYRSCRKSTLKRKQGNENASDIIESKRKKIIDSKDKIIENPTVTGNALSSAKKSEPDFVSTKSNSKCKSPVGKRSKKSDTSEQVKMSESISDTSLQNHNEISGSSLQNHSENQSVPQSHDISSGGCSSVDNGPSRNIHCKTRSSSEDNKPRSYKPCPKSRMQARDAKMNRNHQQNEPLIKKDGARKLISNENDSLEDMNKPGPKSRMQAREAKVNHKHPQNEPLSKRDGARIPISNKNDSLEDKTNTSESNTRFSETCVSLNADRNTPTKRSKISSSQKFKSNTHYESINTHDENILNGGTINSTKEHNHQEHVLGNEKGSNSVVEEDKSIKSVNNCELKKNEIRSKLQTCIAVCFPSLEDQDREKKFDDDNDTVELTSKISRNPNKCIEEQNGVSESKEHDTVSSEVNIQEKVKKFSEQIKALRKVREIETIQQIPRKELKQGGDGINENNSSHLQKSSNHSLSDKKPSQNLLLKKDTTSITGGNEASKTSGYECSKCGRKYQYENFLKVHMKRC